MGLCGCYGGALRDNITTTNLGKTIASTLSTASIAAGLASIVALSPAHAAQNASITRVQLAIDGSCTAASPSILGMTFSWEQQIEDTPGKDIVQGYIVDSTNTVIWTSSGSLGGVPGIPFAVGNRISANPFMRQGATPVDAPFTGIVVDVVSDDRAYVAGDVVDMSDPRIIASLELDVNAVEPDCPGAAPDLTAPQLTSILRNTPGAELTNADSLIWRVTFDEDVQGVDTADFTVSGSSASATSVNQVSADVYEVTASGGDLASYDGVVGLSVSGSASIEDTSSNALTNSNATGATQSYTLDNSAPSVTAFARNTPTEAITEASTLVFDITFDEDVSNVTSDDFEITGGTTATGVLAGSGSSYSLTVSGGNLGTSDSVVISLNLAAAQDITDLAGNALPAGEPTTDEFYFRQNDIQPQAVFSSTATGPVNGPFTLDINWSEDVTAFTVTDLEVDNGSASGFNVISPSEYSAVITPTADGTVTVRMAPAAAKDSGDNPPLPTEPFLIEFDGTPPTADLTAGAVDAATGSFLATVTFSEEVNGFDVSDLTISNGTASNPQSLGGGVYTATITASSTNPVTIDLAAGVATDLAGNPNTAATQLVVTLDTTPPTVALTTSASSPVAGAFDVTATFSEDVTGFDASDLQVTSGAASNGQAVSATVYIATITPSADGDVIIEVPAAVAQDLAGNDNEASTALTLTNDQTAPTVVLSTTSPDPVSGVFSITATFSEDVTGFELADLTVGNGAASNFNAASGSVYTADVTPAADGDVTVDVAAAAAIDAAGNASEAAAQFTIGFDGTPPGATITLPGATVEGPFTATITFTEAVTGFELADIAVTNGAASGLSETGIGAYTVTITPETVGELTVSLAGGAAQDGAGNESEAANASTQVEFPSADANLDLAGTILDPTSVGQTVTLNNPGSAPLAFTAVVDVPWATVDPTSGTIPGSGSLDFTISLTPAADNLDPGDYVGTVTVSTAPASSSTSAGTSSTGSTVVASIPVNVSVAPRFGSLQIVATTPGGLQGDETFTYASSDGDLNGLSLTTSGGTASSAPLRRVFGTYDIAQSLPQGWALDSLVCAGDTDGGSVIDVAAGTADIDLDANETIVCTFANTRDEAAIQLATMRAINNFMVRRADRILSEAPDLSTRLRDRASTSPGRFSADVDGGNVQMNLAGSLSGLRNHAKANERQMPSASDTAAPDESRFDIWFAASYTALDDDRAGDAADSSFGLFQLGADWMVSDNALVGLMVQVDSMEETQDNIVEAAGAIAGAELDGTGWMVGPYAVWEVANGTTLDVLALWGQSDNTINPLGFYEDDFETTRYMLRANLTGEWRPQHSGDGDLVIRPGLAWSYFEETQDAYTDSLGIAIAEQTISIGRLEAGPEVAYRMDGNRPGSWWEPNARLRAVWNYDGADLMDETGRIVDTDGVRADASVGLRGQWSNGAIVSAEARFSGLGDNDFSANGARLELRFPF